LASGAEDPRLADNPLELLQHQIKMIDYRAGGVRKIDVAARASAYKDVFD